MSTIPHDTLLAIIREITKPIGEMMKQSPNFVPQSVVYAVATKEAENLRWHLLLDGNHWLFVDVIENYEPKLEIIQASGDVGNWTTGALVKLTHNQLLALVREAWLGKGDGNATT